MIIDQPMRLDGALDRALDASFPASDPIALGIVEEARSMPQDQPTQRSRSMSDLSEEGVDSITRELRYLLADVFALYMKTKNFHWHMHGPAFRDYHLLLDEHADQLFAMTDIIAERARKIGGTTLRSIGEISRTQRIKDQDQEVADPIEMLSQLLGDSKALTRSLRAAHRICDDASDVATASLIEVWIDEAERRSWFLSEIVGRR